MPKLPKMPKIKPARSCLARRAGMLIILLKKVPISGYLKANLTGFGI